MAEIKKGARARDRKWGGRFTGIVVRVDPSGPWYFVAWDNTHIEDQMGPDEIEVIE